MSPRLGFLTSPCWNQHKAFTQCFLHSKPLIVKLNLLKLQETNLCLHFFLLLQCSVMPFLPLKKIQRRNEVAKQFTQCYQGRIEDTKTSIQNINSSFVLHTFTISPESQKTPIYLPRTEIKGVCHCQWNWSSKAHFAIHSLGQVYFCNELKNPLYKNIIHVHGKRQNVLAPKLTNCFLKDGMFLPLTRETSVERKKSLGDFVPKVVFLLGSLYNLSLTYDYVALLYLPINMFT